ncbi:MAG TPA: RidA family protein [Nevskiaceae bacterium]|nr:RidA family protein [Nevskiaceae bacterium]
MKILNPHDVMVPQGGYSQGVSAGGMVFVAGQVGVDHNGQPVGDFGMAAQTRQTLANVAAVLRDAGLSLRDVVSTTVYVKDFTDYKVFDQVWQECFGDHKPARATVRAELVHPSLLVEVQAIAVHPVR